MVAEEILSEIDATLEQLIQNAQAVQGASISDLTETELDAFKKTQESLLHHLIHLDQMFETKRKSIHEQNHESAAFKIQEKYRHFEKLKSSVNNTIRTVEKKSSIFLKRKSKRIMHSNSSHF